MRTSDTDDSDAARPMHSRRQAVVINDDVEPAEASEAEADEDVPEADNDAEDDIEIDPDLVEPAD